MHQPREHLLTRIYKMALRWTSHVRTRMHLSLFDLACFVHLVEVLRMISEAELQALADLKSILYGLRSERLDILLQPKVRIEAGLVYVGPRGMAVRLVNEVGPKMRKQVLVGSRMEQVLERGSWMICKSPIILNKWSPSLSLKKGEVTKVPVWVKMHNVPLLAYSDVGLSLIATPYRIVPCYLSRLSSYFDVKKMYKFWTCPTTYPKRVKEDVPNALSMVANKPMEDQEEGLVEAEI
ncbi:copia protein [Tanacetum coccineum]